MVAMEDTIPDVGGATTNGMETAKGWKKTEIKWQHLKIIWIWDPTNSIEDFKSSLLFLENDLGSQNKTFPVDRP